MKQLRLSDYSAPKAAHNLLLL